MRDRLACLVFMVIAVVLLIIFPLLQHLSADTVTGTISKTVVDRGNMYFVVRDDGGREEIFENEDSFSFLKFNSGDILMRLEVGKRYQFRVSWFRIPLFSWYRNIISYREL